MTGGQFLGAQFHRHVEEILELDLLVAGHARDRRLAGHVAVGKARHYLFSEAALVIEDVVWDADEVGDAACILDVLTGAAGAFAGNGFPVVVKLERDADDVIALALQKRGDEGAVDTPDMATTTRLPMAGATAAMLVGRSSLSITAVGSRHHQRYNRLRCTGTPVQRSGLKLKMFYASASNLRRCSMTVAGVRHKAPVYRSGAVTDKGDGT